MRFAIALVLLVSGCTQAGAARYAACDADADCAAPYECIEGGEAVANPDCGSTPDGCGSACGQRCDSDFPSTLPACPSGEGCFNGICAS
jgi:hypothetical protein